MGLRPFPINRTSSKPGIIQFLSLEEVLQTKEILFSAYFASLPRDCKFSSLSLETRQKLAQVPRYPFQSQVGSDYYMVLFVVVNQQILGHDLFRIRHVAPQYLQILEEESYLPFGYRLEDICPRYFDTLTKGKVLSFPK